MKENYLELYFNTKYTMNIGIEPEIYMHLCYLESLELTFN